MNNSLIKNQERIREDLLKEFSNFAEFLIVKNDLSSLLDNFSLHYYDFRNNLFNLIDDKLLFSFQGSSKIKNQETILINNILKISIEKKTDSNYTHGKMISLKMNILFPIFIENESITGGLYLDKQKDNFKNQLFTTDLFKVSSYIKHNDLSELEIHVDTYIKNDLEKIFKTYNQELNKIDNYIEHYGNILNALYQSNYNLKEIFNTDTCYSLNDINKEFERLKDILPLTNDLTIETEFKELSKEIINQKENKLANKKLV